MRSVLENVIFFPSVVPFVVQATNFSNPMYGSLYPDRHSTGSELSLDEKRDLLEDTETVETMDDDERAAILR